MKVVLFCGGLGMRIREYPEPVPKPMIPIGYRPLIWHVMKYYAHFGHKDFILCLGYRADAVKKYFLGYDECVSNNFILSEGGRDLRLLSSDIQDWRITFVDTGVNASVGERLKIVKPYLDGESEFLANYSDGVTDLHLPHYIDHFRQRGKLGCFLAVRPPQSYHIVSVEGDVVTGIEPVNRSKVWINGGFFVFRTELFDYLRTGEELVEEPFQRLIHDEQLIACRHEGYWACMDTFKDQQQLEDLWTRGQAPWELWNPARSTHVAHSCNA
ncbi:sugar phosphate nucleotidyltransferase [Planctomyces sp. SH-PL62]|uniref:sugar phosphate nucleotidyltransferase n=1 Tax=Planctomyces sp. SH-PL62 TaxID=1636152 RepID=UPI00078B1DC4|nr:sugar phosphate nucleotidyltransferase [Planctomyces sp. SH-PL62]AMV39212.1 Glucose-1-phosphate cytidylyltransferase [Planctomyces sp. SH-PL62]